ncbi:MAG: hypothetical protein AAGA46_03460 [Cyanobacteria bacterium P01_F01_bin.13]
MKTLQQKPSSGLTFTHQDTEFAITTPDGRNFGHIGYDLTRHQWCYIPFGQPIKATGSLESCKAAAQSDYEEWLNQSVVTEIGSVAPTYILTRTSWRAVGPGFSAYVQVRTRDNEQYKVLVADSFVRRLRIGSTVQLCHKDGKLYLQWTRKPVRRTAVAA